MRFGVLAVDYDGTIANDHGLADGVRPVLAEVRRAGVVVVLVTGRILSDLRRVAGEIDFADAVVAENGAVLSFPESGRTLTLHGPPPPAFLSTLAARGVDALAGECVVEMRADAAHIALDVLRQLELPIVLAFNRQRVMALPPAVSKATGLRELLATLRLSVHNTLAIGDAENDHALLAAAEVGVAVAWGSPALRRAADLVLEGRGPADVPRYLRTLVEQPALPDVPSRRRVVLGQTSDGRPLSLTTRDRNVLVSGDPRSGKSWVAGLLAEQLMLARYCVCVVDPEGDYRTLEQLPGVRVVGEHAPPTPADLEQAFRFPDGGLVVDLSHVSHVRKVDYLQSLLPALVALRRRTGLPHHVVLDEAHYFLRSPSSALGLSLGEGGYTFVTYRPSELAPEVLAHIHAVIGTRHSDPREAAALARHCATCVDGHDAATMLATLSVSEAVLFAEPRDAHGTSDPMVRFKVAPRLTAHVRHRHKYADLPVPHWQRFVFSDAPGQPAAVSLAGFASILAQLDLPALDHHLRHHDFSRWLRDVFGDRTLAGAVEEVEDRVAVSATADPAGEIVAAIRARYDVKGAPPPP